MYLKIKLAYFKQYGVNYTKTSYFKFRKVDGSIREAVGTLTVKYESKGNGKPMPVDSMMYYDTEANGFRSFKVFNLV